MVLGLGQFSSHLASLLAWPRSFSSRLVSLPSSPSHPISTHFSQLFSCIVSSLLFSALDVSSYTHLNCSLFVLSLHFSSLLISTPFSQLFSCIISSRVFSSHLVSSLLCSRCLFFTHLYSSHLNCFFFCLVSSLLVFTNLEPFSQLFSCIVLSRLVFTFLSHFLILSSSIFSSYVSSPPSEVCSISCLATHLAGCFGDAGKKAGKKQGKIFSCRLSSGLRVCVECVRRRKDTVIACLVHRAKRRR